MTSFLQDDDNAKHVLDPSGSLLDQSKKVYCTYWTQHGNCKFEVEGCRYKHEMPNPAKLKELGFSKCPNWYKARMAKLFGPILPDSRTLLDLSARSPSLMPALTANPPLPQTTCLAISHSIPPSTAVQRQITFAAHLRQNTASQTLHRVDSIVPMGVTDHMKTIVAELTQEAGAPSNSDTEET